MHSGGSIVTSLAELCETYLTACKVEGKSPGTISAYRKSLGLLRRVALERKFPTDMHELTVHHAYEFLGFVQEAGAGRSYQHRLHVEVRTFLSWCVRMELLTENVLSRVPVIRRE